MKKCSICNGDLESKHVSVEREWNGKKLLSRMFLQRSVSNVANNILTEKRHLD